MPNNLDRYKKDLEALIETGGQLANAITFECKPEEFKAEVKRQLGNKAKEFIEEIPSFSSTYQRWYSESKVLIKLLLPDRLDDFVRHYEKPKGRKDISFENYRIEDALQGLRITRAGDVLADAAAAIPHVQQQFQILKSVQARFESSLFDIRQLVAADLLDSELEAAGELAKNKFLRAAGAVAGVVLEKHLMQVCNNHSIKVSKKAAGINDLNELLKRASVIDVPQWRFIQHLGDIRNLCDHNKAAEPTPSQVDDLVTGVGKVTKTIF